MPLNQEQMRTAMEANREISQLLALVIPSLLKLVGNPEYTNQTFADDLSDDIELLNKTREVEIILERLNSSQFDRMVSVRTIELGIASVTNEQLRQNLVVAAMRDLTRLEIAVERNLDLLQTEEYRDTLRRGRFDLENLRLVIAYYREVKKRIDGINTSLLAFERPTTKLFLDDLDRQMQIEEQENDTK